MVWWHFNCQQLCVILVFFTLRASSSFGDRLPEFQHCLDTRELQEWGEFNSYALLSSKAHLTKLAFLHRVLLWNCDSECDYTCQHIITNQRTAAGKAVVQFHGKWPFYRFLGIQEPFSVLFSMLNFLAHHNGLSKIRARIPASYSLRRFYVIFAYSGMASWVFSMIFHTRDYALTEQLDYLAAGGSVLYGLYYTPIRIFRIDLEGKRSKSILRAWTILCISMYMSHVIYMKLYKWDYRYNILANVIVGITQNAMWSWFSVRRYQQSGQFWAIWPGIVVTWVILAMSLELMDFPPLWGYLDAHSLWHLGTVGPTIIWYNFLIKDAQDDLATVRYKA
ncbi:Protein PER1-like protein [Golovinomyces cichoracearum]|uniref:Post-GPI attachment to proteins factor 3 n=1 Tax=Golovinomyces cichoracearum TaxID=62708 RepID=A0A420IXQ9_9PEZI|nr:Protein PER1-like protein [Golovinomyces cichoracearum]